MSFYQLVARRQSDRKYDSSRLIPREVLLRIAEAARLAPSATNSQPWHFIVVDEPNLCHKVATALTSPITGNMNHFAQQATAFVVLVEEPVNITSKLGGILKQKHFPHIDLGIAAEHIALAATEEGLGSCIIGRINEAQVRKALGIPRHKRVPLVVALGYSLEQTKQKRRKPAEEVISFNQYQSETK